MEEEKEHSEIEEEKKLTPLLEQKSIVISDGFKVQGFEFRITVMRYHYIVDKMTIYKVRITAFLDNNNNKAVAFIDHLEFLEMCEHLGTIKSYFDKSTNVYTYVEYSCQDFQIGCNSSSKGFIPFVVVDGNKFNINQSEFGQFLKLFESAVDRLERSELKDKEQ